MKPYLRPQVRGILQRTVCQPTMSHPFNKRHMSLKERSLENDLFGETVFLNLFNTMWSIKLG